MPRLLRLAVPLLALLVALGLAATPASATGRPGPGRDSGHGHGPGHGPRQLRVLTYNIHHWVGEDGVLDLERIARVIEASGADVVGLQEVDRHFDARSDFVDQPAWFAHRLRMQSAYAANLDLDPAEPGQPRRQYGTLVLSRYPIVSSANLLLPRPGTTEQRGLLQTVVDVHGTRVRFATTHLESSSADARAQQSPVVADTLAASREPVVLTGDLNAEPGDPELAPLLGTLADTWAESGRGDGFTYPAPVPTARIDLVLTSRQLRASRPVVIDSQASDHRPYAVSIDLGRRPRHR